VGQGLRAGGVQGAIDLAFGQLGAVRVYACTMADNTASRRVMEKVGLRFARSFHEDFPDGSTVTSTAWSSTS